MKRRTLAKAFVLGGVGLHGGAPVRVEVKPAAAGAGRSIARVDLAGAPSFPVHLGSVRGASFATTLGLPGPSEATVSTVEHLLAALVAAGIDDARIEIDGPEVPAVDGSSLPFVEALADAGVVSNGESTQPIVVTETIEIVDGERRLSVEPAEVFGIDVEIDFDHPRIGRQHIALPELTPEAFARELAPARTFAFFEEVEWLRSQGLAAGGSLDNTIVLDHDGVMNPGGLRFPDEFVRHKALDLIGDLALLARPLQGRVRATRGGHALHHQLVRAVLERVDDPSGCPDAAAS